MIIHLNHLTSPVRQPSAKIVIKKELDLQTDKEYYF